MDIIQKKPTARTSPTQNTSTFKADILSTSTSSSLKISQFIQFPAGSTPGNVGVAVSGGSSRAMIAGMGQLRGLKTLTNAQGNLLGQTRAISAVSGGTWLSLPFMFLNQAVSDDAYLGVYQDPGFYTVENLQQLEESNIGKRCTENFSAKDLAFQGILLIIAGLPDNLIWQMLMGIHLLKYYGLYTQSQGLPDSFFSYDKNTLKEIIQQNPSLTKQTAYLITTGDNRVNRPYFICNASMFVNVLGELKQSLAPVQITPFFTGILSTPPHAIDISHQSVGSGGVTSFGFNSTLQAMDEQAASVLQSRQFSLTDANGVSSAFFAEYIQKQAPLWDKNLKLFFDDFRTKLRSDGSQKLINNIPAENAQKIQTLLNKLDSLRQQHDEIGNEQLLTAAIDPKIFHDALQKLASFVPQYDYWPVNNTHAPVVSAENAFADGGNLENTGVAALLLYEDIDNIIAFVNCATPLEQAEHGIIDASGQEIPDTCIKVDGQISALFGYQPYNDSVGYQLYCADHQPNNPLLKHNQIFPSEAFAELVQGLWQQSGNKDHPGSNQHAANYLQTLTTVENKWFGIRPGKPIKILWVYNNLINDWYQQLSDSVRQQIFNNDPTQYYQFPHYSTYDTQLTATQINLLASQTAWSVVKGSPSEILSLYQQ